MDEELSSLVLSVSAHDGSFDDVLDESGCFSVKFPYDILYKGNIITIESVNDLLSIDPSLEARFQFPIQITFSDYVEVTIESEADLQIARASCATNTIFLESIQCVDFIYPVEIAVFNSETSSFETLTVDHDQETFLSVVAFTAQDRASIQFPVSIQFHDGAIVPVFSEMELIQIVSENADDCD